MTPDFEKKLVRLLSGPSPLGKAAMKLQQYRTGPSTYHIKHQPYCDDPVPIERHEPRSAAGYVGLTLMIHAPCRKCAKCLLFRQLKWAERISKEIEQAPRSWFVVLTFDPIHLSGVAMESYALKDKLLGGTPEGIERAAYKHVQDYMKRLRKSGGRFRYFGVAEYGEENGRLHFHLVVHEIVSGSVKKSDLQGKWRSFVYAKLVKTGTADRTGRYVSKYLTKSLSIPRASLGYGKK